MTSLWTSSEIAAATGGETSGPFDCTGVSIDSRTITRGDLFIALTGPSNDAHAFVADAFRAGASGALVRSVPEGIDPARLVVVNDTFAALHALGRAGRTRLSGHVIGVTGSVGKTSTKDMLGTALSSFGTTHIPVGSFNNHWGVPLTLARAARDTACTVLEMGMNHAGELRSLTQLARPHGAVITWIAPAHLEFFGSVAAIARAKAEIFEGIEKEGFAVLPRDSDYFSLLADLARNQGLNVTSFGTDTSSTVRLLSHSVTAGQTMVQATVDETSLSYSIGAAGRHWAMNSLAVLCVTKALGLCVEKAARSLATVIPAKGRGRRHTLALSGGEAILIDESYNANPDSIAATLAALGLETPEPGGRRIAVLGDMLELGEKAPSLHAEISPAIITNRIDAVFTCGPLMAHLAAALPSGISAAHTADSATLTPLVVNAIRPGDIIMVKGSLGSAMGRITDALISHIQTNDTDTKGNR